MYCDCLVLILRLHLLFTLVLGTMLASLVPLVSFNAVMICEHFGICEHFASFPVFIIVQHGHYIKHIVSSNILKVTISLVISIGMFVSIVLVAILVALMAKGPQTDGVDEVHTVLYPTYASKYIPIIASTTYLDFIFCGYKYYNF